MADREAHAHIVVADLGGERLQPIMAGNAAAHLHAHFALRKVELVVKGDNVAEIELVEAHRLADRATRLVHESLRLEQKHLLPAELAFGSEAREALAPGRDAVRCGNRFSGLASEGKLGGE